jgi:hypothetical protein
MSYNGGHLGFLIYTKNHSNVFWWRPSWISAQHKINPHFCWLSKEEFSKVWFQMVRWFPRIIIIHLWGWVEANLCKFFLSFLYICIKEIQSSHHKIYHKIKNAIYFGITRCINANHPVLDGCTNRSNGGTN